MEPSLQPSYTFPSRHDNANLAVGLDAQRQLTYLTSVPKHPTDINIETSLFPPTTVPPVLQLTTIDPNGVLPIAENIYVQPGLAEGLTAQSRKDMDEVTIMKTLSSNLALKRGNYQAAEHVLGRQTNAEEINNKTVTPNKRPSQHGGPDVHIGDRTENIGTRVKPGLNYQSLTHLFTQLGSEIDEQGKKYGIPPDQIARLKTRYNLFAPSDPSGTTYTARSQYEHLFEMIKQDLQHIRTNMSGLRSTAPGSDNAQRQGIASTPGASQNNLRGPDDQPTGVVPTPYVSGPMQLPLEEEDQDMKDNDEDEDDEDDDNKSDDDEDDDDDDDDSKDAMDHIFHGGKKLTGLIRQSLRGANNLLNRGAEYAADLMANDQDDTLSRETGETANDFDGNNKIVAEQTQNQNQGGSANEGIQPGGYAAPLVTDVTRQYVNNSIPLSSHQSAIVDWYTKLDQLMNFRPAKPRVPSNVNNIHTQLQDPPSVSVPQLSLEQKADYTLYQRTAGDHSLSASNEEKQAADDYIRRTYPQLSQPSSRSYDDIDSRQNDITSTPFNDARRGYLDQLKSTISAMRSGNYETPASDQFMASTNQNAVPISLQAQAPSRATAQSTSNMVNNNVNLSRTAADLIEERFPHPEATNSSIQTDDSFPIPMYPRVAPDTTPRVRRQAAVHAEQKNEHYYNVVSKNNRKATPQEPNQKFSRGWGVYSPFGKHFIHTDKLYRDGILSLSNGSGRKVNRIKNEQLVRGGALHHALCHVVEGRKPQLKKLSAEDRVKLDHVLHRSRVQAGQAPMTGADVNVDPLEQVQIVMGEIDAGNDAPALKTQLRKLTTYLHQIGELDAEHIASIRSEYLS